MSQARGGFGTKLYRDSTGAGSFQQVAEIGDVTGPAVSQVIEDATHMDSPDGYAEKIAVGLREAGDLSFSMHLIQDDASQNGLLADLNSSTPRTYRLVFPTGTKRITFTGLVQSIGASYPVRGKMMNDVVITVSGKPVKEAHP
jgi:hypothetical protein